MNLHPELQPIEASPLARHRTHQVRVGKVRIGGEAPVELGPMAKRGPQPQRGAPKAQPAGEGKKRPTRRPSRRPKREQAA